MFSEQGGGDAPEPQTQDQPDEGTGPAVEPIQGDQGPQVAEQDPADATGANPDNAVRVSAPPPEAQSGVPQIPGGVNEGVEPQPEFSGPVGDSGQSPGGSHPEASQADNAEEGTAPGEGAPESEGQ